MKPITVLLVFLGFTLKAVLGVIALGGMFNELADRALAE